MPATSSVFVTGFTGFELSKGVSHTQHTFSKSLKVRAHFSQYKALHSLQINAKLKPANFPLHTKQIFFSLETETSSSVTF